MDSSAMAAESPNKRPRSPTGEYAQIASKAPKTQSNHLQINYLARQYTENLPLVSANDTMPAITHLIGEYDGVLQRHESIAGNLGACPLGPILVKRFERLFDGPPRVLKSHGKDAPNVTWLDVVEFAKSKPEQFNLERTRNGARVCQFYTKQCRVEISEEDFVLVASGMPQKMIPPQPIIEDEEKELGALEILEKNLQQIIQAADQVSARARQLNHRLKNRRTAIVARRENDASLHSHQPSAHSPPWREHNGSIHSLLNGNNPPNSHSPSSGFVAVNSSRPGAPESEDNGLSSHFALSHPNTDNVTIINGTSIKGASPTTRAELMKKFFSTADRQARGFEDPPGQPAQQQSRPRPRVSDPGPGEHNMYDAAPATVPIPHTPTSLLPPQKSQQIEKDDGCPYKLEMVAQMEELQRGNRIMPPCDRCRRLHMDCLKNLTACMGCTKKHAKCTWKDVREEELHEVRAARAERRSRDHTEDASDDQPPAVQAEAPGPVPTPPFRDIERQQQESRPGIGWGFDNRHESAPARRESSGSHHLQSEAPRRTLSEGQGSAASNHNRRVSLNRTTDPRPDDDDPGANHRLMQAILDTVSHHSRGSANDDGNDANNDREREHRVLST